MTTTQPPDSLPLPDLPQEIITDILSRLPVKSLLKFRCVSKSWLLLISSSHFVKAHLKISTKNNVYSHDRLIFGSKGFPMDLYTGFVQSAVDESVSSCSIYPLFNQDLLVQRVWFDYALYGPDDVTWLVGSCNGLVCVSLSVETLILWNPTTRKSNVLPKSGADLDFDYCGITFGFGYDDLTDDYKVVEFFSFERVTGTGTLEIQVKVYSLRANSWKTLLNWPGGDTFGGSGKFFNGAIHWSVSDFDGPVEWEIVSHDLSTDAFAVLLLPNFEDDDVRVEVKILGDCLAVCCEHNTHVDVWLMKEYGVKESWTKVACIPFFLDLRDHAFARPCPLFLSVDGRILVNYGSNLSMYDPRNPQIHHFSTSLEVEAITYFESLVSPNLDDRISIGRALPLEIITEILLRLPVKSLLRFSTVSKGCLSLISSSHFAKTHLKNLTKNDVYIHERLIFGSKGFPSPMNLYTCSLESVVDVSVSTSSIYPLIDQDLLVHRVWVDYPLYEPDDVIWLVGSCNGLLCLSFSVETLILWNPTTRKSKILPDSGTDLDFDYSAITFGFGYDDLHDDYKVVEFFSFEHVTGTGTLEIQVKVYSLRANSWKTLLNWPGGDTFGGSGKFFNGTIHWSVSDFDGPVEWEIVSHDLATDTFAVLLLPNFEDDDVRVELKILGGCLAVCCEYNTHMDVWLMKEYGVGESWTKVACIPFFLDLRDHEFTRPCPLFLSMDGRILINYGSNLSMYDPRKPHIHHFSTSLEVEATTYFESLVSPNLEDDIGAGRTLPL